MSTTWHPSLLALAILVGACERAPEGALENATPSPNASILPAPLSSAVETPARGATGSLERAELASKAGSSEGGTVVPLPMRVDQPPDDDSLPLRDLIGVALDGEWRYSDPAVPLKFPEMNQAGIEAARKWTAPRMNIELAPQGRMRVTFTSRGLPLRQGAEVRSRTDHYGHVLVWPNGTGYRVLPVGAVRTLLGERRIDAIPLVRPLTSVKGEGLRRLGFPTKKWEIATRNGKMVLELARIAGAGESGALWCRFLSEIIALDPSAAPCFGDEVPLRAQFTWPRGGGVTFEAIAVSEKVELSPSLLLVPPAESDFTPGSPPPDAGGPFLTSDELAAFRTRPAEVAALLAPGAPRDGLLLHNATDVARYVFLDSVPIAWVDPNRDQLVLGPLRGRYQLQWRTFLGEAGDPPLIVDLPARVSIGSADGGR
ncbi:MAG TPA: hypothetical protein VK540_30020 [Polyangiaceae bacterium]|nr:hypothetical protein [Polyangiaceae bacterium]